MVQLRSQFGRVFYGWWIVLSAFIIFMTSSGLLFSGFGAYFVPIQEQMRWSKTAISGAFSMSRLESGLLGPIQGWLVQKLGPRLIIQIGVVSMGIGFMLFSQVHSLLTFYLASFVMALGSSFAGYLALSTSLVNWFEKKRATALGISNSGFGVGGLVVPALAWAILNYGWRPTAFYSGLIVIALLLPASFLIRRAPEDYGMLPDGDQRQGPQQKGDRVAGPVPGLGIQGGLTAKQILKSSAFWYTSLGHGCALFAVSAMMLHLIPYVVDTVELSVQAAAVVAVAMTSLQLTGQFGGGFVSDRIDKRMVIVVCMLGHTVALMGLAFTTSLTVIVLLAALHGLAWGVRGPLMAAIRADYFGRRSFATVMGYASLVVMIGMLSGPIIAGFAADVFGSYRWGFVVLAIIPAIGAVFFYLAKKPELEIVPVAP